MRQARKMNELALSHEREEEKSKELMDSSKRLVQKVEHDMYLKNKQILKINTMYDDEDGDTDNVEGTDVTNERVFPTRLESYIDQK